MLESGKIWDDQSKRNFPKRIILKRRNDAHVGWHVLKKIRTSEKYRWSPEIPQRD